MLYDIVRVLLLTAMLNGPALSLCEQILSIKLLTLCLLFNIIRL